MRKLLLALLIFNAATASAGSVGLMTGALTPPVSWLENTPFGSYLLPGIVLATVGASSLFAAVTVIYKSNIAYIASAYAGIIMIEWILAELLLIRRFNWLQVLFLATGAATTALALQLFRPHDQRHTLR